MSRLFLGVLVVLAIALGVNVLVSNSETKPAKADGGRIVRLPGGDLNVRETNTRGGRPIVLLHGFSASVRWWDDVTPALARGHRVVAIDLLGHGGSEKPREGYSMPEQGRRVARVLDRLGVENATVVGHSMGANAAIALAEADPRAVGGLVLLDGGARRKYHEDSALSVVCRQQVIGQACRRLATDGVAKKAIEVGFAEGYDVPDRLQHDLGRMTWTSFSTASRKSADYANQRAPDERVAALRVPVLVVWGGKDRLVDPDAVREYRDVPLARTRIIRGSGHSPQVERARETARLILGAADRR